MASENVLADRRFSFAEMLKERGDLEAAISLYEEALALEPDWAAAHFQLADTLEAAGRAQDACRHFTDYLRLADTDEMGAEIRLALLGAAPVPETMPEAYVRALFDQYAERFEESLLTKLEYSAPEKLFDAVRALLRDGETLPRVLDLGCGTGLAGERFRPLAGWLSGIDLSPAMIHEAGRKSLYDDLQETDVARALSHQTDALDLIVAADVFVYMGALDGVFDAAARALVPGGLFAFSIEESTDGDFSLGAHCRYAHGEDYIRRLAAEHGFEVRSLMRTACRLEGGVALPHLVCVLQAPLSDAEAVPALGRYRADIPAA